MTHPQLHLQMILILLLLAVGTFGGVVGFASPSSNNDRRRLDLEKLEQTRDLLDILMEAWGAFDPEEKLKIVQQCENLDEVSSQVIANLRENDAGLGLDLKNARQITRINSFDYYPVTTIFEIDSYSSKTAVKNSASLVEEILEAFEEGEGYIVEEGVCEKLDMVKRDVKDQKVREFYRRISEQIFILTGLNVNKVFLEDGTCEFTYTNTDF